MLSKLSNLVLGLIWKRPLNPYEIVKLMESPFIQDWFPMTAASIYTTIKNLAKDGYIIGETLREGNLPPKTVYTLTMLGEEALLDSLSTGLESYNPQSTDFGVSLFHICSMKKEAALELLQKRLAKLEEMKSKADERLALSLLKAPFNFIMMLKYNVYRISTEIRVTREMLETLQGEVDWNSSFVNLLK